MSVHPGCYKGGGSYVSVSYPTQWPSSLADKGMNREVGYFALRGMRTQPIFFVIELNIAEPGRAYKSVSSTMSVLCSRGGGSVFQSLGQSLVISLSLVILRF